MKIAFLMKRFSLYGHPRLIFNELPRLFGKNAVFYFSQEWERFRSIYCESLKEFFFFNHKDFSNILKKLLKSEKIDVLIAIDIDKEVLENLNRVLSDGRIPLKKRVILYHPGSMFLPNWLEEMVSLAEKGVKFLWEHEVGYLIAMKFLPRESNSGFLQVPISISEKLELTEKFDISFPGRFEEEKGASVFLKVIPCLSNKKYRIRADLLGRERLLCELAKYHNRIRLRKEIDKVFGVFIRETFSSKLLFLPYDPYHYSLASSGLLKEAMVYGIPVVVTDGCWLSYYLERHNGAGVLLKNRVDVNEIVSVLEEALKSYEDLKEKALRVKGKMREECSSERFKLNLLSMLEGEQQSLGVIDSQLPSFENMLRKAESHFWYKFAMGVLPENKMDEAEEYLEKAILCDAFNPRALLLKSCLLVRKGRYSEALSLLERIEEQKLISPSILLQVYIEKAKLFKRVGKSTVCRAILGKIKGNRHFLTFRSITELIKLLEINDKEIIYKLLEDVDFVVGSSLPSIFKLRYAVDGMWLSSIIEDRLKFNKYLKAFHNQFEGCVLSMDAVETTQIGRAIWGLIESLLKRKWEKEARHVLDCLWGRFELLIPVFLYNLASLYEQIGDLGKSKKIFCKVLDLGERKLCGGVYYHLGEIAMKEGNLKEAERNFKKCLSIIPEHKKARLRLKEIMEIRFLG